MCAGKKIVQLCLFEWEPKLKMTAIHRSETLGVPRQFIWITKLSLFQKTLFHLLPGLHTGSWPHGLVLLLPESCSCIFKQWLEQGAAVLPLLWGTAAAFLAQSSSSHVLGSCIDSGFLSPCFAAGFIRHSSPQWMRHCLPCKCFVLKYWSGTKLNSSDCMEQNTVLWFLHLGIPRFGSVYNSGSKD